MAKKTAGILLFRKKNSSIEFMLVHPGGPFWAKKEAGAWSIPKGEFDEPEEPLEAAKREFFEETGTAVDGNFITLTPVRLKSGKMFYAFALEQDLDTTTIHSNIFPMEWPPRSGKYKEFPEVDRGEWMDEIRALEMINAGQAPLIKELIQKLE